MASALLLATACARQTTHDNKKPEPGPKLGFEQLMVQRGVMTYAVRTYDPSGEAKEVSAADGLALMRQPDQLRSVGGRFYDDGFGNLLRYGWFVSPKLGGRVCYSLGFMRDGGLQLAMDFREDHIVDVLVDVRPDGWITSLANPDDQWMIDCMAGQLAGGANLADALNACVGSLSGGNSSGGGGGGPLDPQASSDLNRFLKPDCSHGKGGPPNSTEEPSFSGEFESTTVYDLGNGYTLYDDETEYDDGSSTFNLTVYDSEGQIVLWDIGHRDSDGAVVDHDVHHYTYNPGTDEYTDHVLSFDHGEKTKDETHSGHGSWLDLWIGPAMFNDGGYQPPPSPVGGNAPVEDPRCAPSPTDIQAMWKCHEETGDDLMECLHRMRDEIYTATGGRCQTVPGAAGGTTIKCNDQRLEDCLNSGGSIAQCILKNPAYSEGHVETGPEGDDFFHVHAASGAKAGMYIDTTPLGAVFLGLCAHGAEGFCGKEGTF